MRMIQLHPEQLVDQCIDQSNGIFAGKLTGKLTRDDAELMEKCFTSEIRGLTCVSPHAHLNNTVTVIELLVYEALLQKSREVHDIKDVHALLQELHSDPKKLFDTLGILEKAYTIYQEFDANYMATRTPIPTGYGRLPEPRRSTVSRGL